MIGPKGQIDQIRPVCTSFPNLVVQLFIPCNYDGQRPKPIFNLRMGKGCKEDTGRIMSFISGPNSRNLESHFIKTKSGETLLDISSVIMSTLVAGGNVVSLASGECRLFDLLKPNETFTRMLQHQFRVYAGFDREERKLNKWEDIGGVWGKKVISPQFNCNQYMGYSDFVINKAPRDTLAFTGTGRVNLV